MIQIIIQVNGNKIANQIKIDKSTTLNEIAHANLMIDKIKDQLKSLEFKDNIKYESKE